MKQPSNTFHNIPEYDYLKPASTQDCTGLIPAGPVDEEEIEQYEELYSFLPPFFSTHMGAGMETSTATSASYPRPDQIPESEKKPWVR